MIHKKIIVGSICAGLMFTQLSCLNSCFANQNEDFQYNLKPRNPLADENFEMKKEQIITPSQNQNNRSKQELLSKIEQKNTPQMNCENKYGIELFKDKGFFYDNLFITDVIPNSPAERAGLRIGDRILRINKQKVRSMSVEDANYVMDRTQSMTLQIRDKNNNKRTINLARGQVCIAIPPLENEIFSTYWNQIYDGEYDLEFIHQKIQKLNKVDLSKSTKSEIRQMEDYVTYWLKKKKIFKNSYKACTLSSYDDISLTNCMSIHVNRELTKIAKEEEYAQKRFEIASKLQMFAMAAAATLNLSGAINNHAHALRNQSVDVHHSGKIDANLHHSGTINLRHLRY